MSDKMDYSELSKKLDEILEQLESLGATDLDKAIALHKEGDKVIASMQQYLQDSSKKIKKITK